MTLLMLTALASAQDADPKIINGEAAAESARAGLIAKTADSGTLRFELARISPIPTYISNASTVSAIA